MRITPDEEQIRKVMDDRNRTLIFGIVFAVAAVVMLVICIVYLRNGRSFSMFCALAMSVAVLAAHIPGYIRAAADGLDGLVAADTYICLENGLFAVRDVYHDAYEGCIFVTDRIAEIIEAKGRYPRFFVRSRDVSEDSCIFSDDVITDETLFLVDGKKYDQDEFLNMYDALVRQVPKEADIAGTSDTHPLWGPQRHTARTVISVALVVFAFVIPEALYITGIFRI